MIHDPFPDRIDALKLFTRNGSITAVLPIARLHRLSLNLQDTNGQVVVDLHFGLDANKKMLLTGTLDSKVIVLCQRCMSEMELDLHSDLYLKVCANDKQLRALPKSEDAIVIDETGLNILEVIEDELILSLPIVTLHSVMSCNKADSADAHFTAISGLENGENQIAKDEKQSPFAMLATLKGKL
jgi:uncharacterized protein